MGDISAEPSMEEILSSIKRIMAEEGEGPVRSRRPVRPVATTAASPSYGEEEGDSILELDDPISPAPRIMPDPVTAPRPTTMADAPAPRREPVADDAEEAPPAPAVAPRGPVPEQDADDAAPIVSDRATAVSRQAIDQLTRTLSAAIPPAAPAGTPTADASLEGLVRELLRPMLREWLDNRLPAIVEQQVAREIARITGGR